MQIKYANDIHLGSLYTLTRDNTRITGICLAVWTDHQSGNLALTRIKLEHLGWIGLSDWEFAE